MDHAQVAAKIAGDVRGREQNEIQSAYIHAILAVHSELETMNVLLGALVTELKNTGPKTNRPYLYEREVPIGSNPVSDDYPT